MAHVIPNSLTTVLLVYDIAEQSKFPNPSPRLHPIGFRINLSCWIIPITQLPEDLLNDFAGAGIDYEVFQFAEHEEEKIRMRAKRAIEAHAAEIHTSLIKSLDSATQAFRAAEAQVKAECDSELVAHLLTAEADKKRRQRMKGALRVAADRLNAAVACAELFDDTMELKDCLKGLEEAIKARREAFEVTLTAMVGI